MRARGETADPPGLGARYAYGYSPDFEEKARQTIIEQAELLGADWAT